MTTNTPIRKDWFMSGLLMGMTVSVVKTLVSMGLAKAGVPIKPYASTAGSMVFAKRRSLSRWLTSPKQSRWENAVGHSADVAFGGLLGIIMSYALTKVPPGNEIVKGVAIGGGISAGTMMLAKILKVDVASEMTPQEFTSTMALAVLFGVVEGAWCGRYTTQMVAQSHPFLVKNVTNRQFEKGRLRVHAPQ